ncbi:hypothetical protein BWR19_03515 [Halomonas sp. 1513]|nr:hypothetical protein [Halomonas sp. 1513]APX92080.1 hypothetical protein BWR19_03515 [Halomonas sp. 1513]
MSRLALTHPLHLVIGLTLWSLWFVAIYGGLSVACAVAPPAAEQGALTAINVALGLLTVATTALLGWLAWACLEAARDELGRPRFVAAVSAGLYLFSAVATLFVGIPVIGVPPCL